MSIANYANRFKSFGGESFARAGEKKLKSAVLVRSTLTKSNGDKISLDYFLRQVKGKWRIVNIRADGVSELSTKKSEYGKILSGSGGYDALIDKIRAKVRELEAG